MTTSPTNTTAPQSAWKGPYFAECGNLWRRNPDGILVAIGCARGEDDERDEEFVAERLAALLNAGTHADALREALEGLVAACEADFCGPSVADVPDEEAVALGTNGPCAVTFGMIRRARAALTSAREGQ